MKPLSELTDDQLREVIYYGVDYIPDGYAEMPDHCARGEALRELLQRERKWTLARVASSLAVM